MIKKTGQLKNLGVLALVLVLCLATVGVGFANWSDTLTIGGTVNTGEVAVEFSDCKSNDPESALGLTNVTTMDPTECGTWIFGDVDDSDTWLWAGDRLCCEDRGITECDIYGGDYLQITMAEGYPGYSGHVAFSIENVGSIPVDVEYVTLVNVSRGGHEITVNEPLTPAGSTKFVRFDFSDPNDLQAFVDDGLQYDLEGNVITEYSLTLSHLAVDQQIHAGEKLPGDICYCVQLGSKSAETYDFLIEISACQWNE